MIERLHLTEIDRRRLALIDATDPGVVLECEETRERARAAWELWELTHR